MSNPAAHTARVIDATYPWYALIDADGHFGDHATVYSRHRSPELARRAAEQCNSAASTHRVQIIAGTQLVRGMKIHRTHLGRQYRRLPLEQTQPFAQAILATGPL